MCALVESGVAVGGVQREKPRVSRDDAAQRIVRSAGR